MKKIYIAGWDVFRLDAVEYFNTIKTIASDNGFTALVPIDNDCTNALQIKQSNCQMIKSSDYVIANITPFRGADVESGTAYEIGYAEALDKEVVLWSEDRRVYKDKVAQGFYIDQYSVEDFNLTTNLMIQGDSSVWASFEKAIQYLKNLK